MFRILIEVLFVVWLLLAVQNKKFRPKRSWILWSLLFFLSVIFVADIFGENPHLSLWGSFNRMEGFVTLVHLFGYFLVVGTILRERKDWEKFFGLSVVVSVILSIIALLQLAGFLSINTSDGRLDSTIGNAAFFAFYLLLHIFLALFLLVSRQDLKGRYFYSGVILLEVVVLYFTATRGSILALMIGVLVTAGLLIFFESREKKSKKPAIAAVFLIVLIVSSFVLLKDHSLVKNNLTLNRLSLISLEDIKDEPRYRMWVMGYKGFKDNPILGQGQENFNLLYNKYYEPSLYKFDESINTRAHNVFIEWLVAGGILGLLGYLAIIVSLFCYIWFSKNNSLNTIEKSVISGLVFAYLVNNSFLFDNITSYILFFSLLAFIHYLHTNHGEKSKENYGWEISYKPISLALIVVTVLIYSFNFKGVASAYHYKKGIDLLPGKPEESLNHFQKSLSYNSLGRSDVREGLASIIIQNYLLSEATEELKNEFIQLAMEGMNQEIVSEPNAQTYYVTGYVYFLAGKHSEALELLKKAHGLAPRKQEILLAIRKVYIYNDQFEQALAASRIAYELDPNIGKARIPYAISRMYAGVQDQEFLAEMNFLKEHLKQVPDDVEAHLALANAYLKLGDRDSALEEVKEAIDNNPSFRGEGGIFIQQIKNMW